MAQESKEVTISGANWTPEIEQMLLPACPCLTEVKAQVDSGAAQLFKASSAGNLLLAFVLRVDRMADSNQGVIVAAAGDGGGINLFDTLLPAIERMFLNCASVRIHTRRRGLAKRLMQTGYEFEEIVLIRDLHK